MNIKVSKDNVVIETDCDNHVGEYNVNECYFQFDTYFNDVSVKRAIFTIQTDAEISVETDIINNTCQIPYEVLIKPYTYVTMGVYGYDLKDNVLTLRYSPEPTKFMVSDGSYRDGASHPEMITPSQYDIYSEALQKGLAEVDKKLDEINKNGTYAKEQGDYAKEQGDYAKEQANNVIKANVEASKIIDKFEDNVNEYTTAFDNNASEKLKSYNDNSVAKTNKFDDNYDNKVSQFNDNAVNKINDYNSNAEQKIAEYDKHSEELDKKIVSTRNELERVKNDILETGTASDTFIHVEDSAWAEMQELEVDGVLKQETTKGRQLYDYKDLKETYSFLTFDEDGWYTATCDNTSGSSGKYYNFTTDISNLLETNTIYSIVLEIKSITVTGNAGTVTACDRWGQFATAAASSSTVGTKVGTSTTKSDFTGINQFLASNIFAGANSKVTATFRISVIKGTEITPQNFEYEPFTGGQQSPSPDFPQEIKTIIDSLNVTSCNKNLFNKNDFKVLKNYYIGVYGNVGQAVTNSIIYMPIKRNTSYSIQKISSNRFRVGTYNNLEVLGKTLNNVIKNLNDSITSYTLNNDNDKYLFFQYLGGDSNEQEILESIQIEEGQKTPFEEHIQSQITANLPEGEFIGKIDDTYKDALNVVYKNDGKYHLILNKRIRHFKLPISDMGNIDNYPGWKGQIIQPLDTDFPLRDNFLSEYTNYISNITNNKNTYRVNTGYQGRPTLYFNINSIFGSDMTQTKIKEKYPNLIVDLYYGIPKGNQYTVDLGVVDMPLSYNEVTNIFTDSDLLPIINATYYRNFIKTVQNLQVNEKALKQELIDINNRLTALETAKSNESEVTNDIPVE